MLPSKQLPPGMSEFKHPHPPPRYTTVLHPNDVLLGRGVPIFTYPGNVRFRELAQERKERYASSCRRETKNELAKEIIAIVRQRNGRFLREVIDPSEASKLGIPRGKQGWVYAEDHTVLQKVKQAMREPDPPQSTATRTRPNQSQRPRRSDPLASQLDPSISSDSSAALLPPLASSLPDLNDRARILSQLNPRTEAISSDIDPFSPNLTLTGTARQLNLFAMQDGHNRNELRGLNPPVFQHTNRFETYQSGLPLHMQGLNQRTNQPLLESLALLNDLRGRHEAAQNERIRSALFMQRIVNLGLDAAALNLNQDAALRLYLSQANDANALVGMTPLQDQAADVARGRASGTAFREPLVNQAVLAALIQNLQAPQQPALQENQLRTLLENNAAMELISALRQGNTTLFDRSNRPNRGDTDVGDSSTSSLTAPFAATHHLRQNWGDSNQGQIADDSINAARLPISLGSSSIQDEVRPQGETKEQKQMRSLLFGDGKGNDTKEGSSEDSDQKQRNKKRKAKDDNHRQDVDDRKPKSFKKG